MLCERLPCLAIKRKRNMVFWHVSHYKKVWNWMLQYLEKWIIWRRIQTALQSLVSWYRWIRVWCFPVFGKHTRCVDKTLGRLLCLMIFISVWGCAVHRCVHWHPDGLVNCRTIEWLWPRILILFNPYSCFAKLYDEFRQKQTWSQLGFKDRFK